MSAALRLAPFLPPSMRPTLVVPARTTTKPTSGTTMRVSEAPTTQRSATVHPRVEAAARHEAYSLLAVMRLNADFLASLLDESSTPVALDALADLQRGIDRLEQRFASSMPLIPTSR